MRRAISFLRVGMLCGLALVVPACGDDTGTGLEQLPTTGTIQGTVLVDGAGLSAWVTLTWSDSTRTVELARSTGRYYFYDLAPGTYTITVGRYGRGASFPQYQQRATIVAGGDLVNVDFTGTRIEIGKGFGLEQFSFVPAGTFLMGDDNSSSSWERPAHTVNLTQPFYIQRTEVTQQQWESVMGSNPSWYPDCGADCPVDMVAWDDIQEFLAKLNEAFPEAGFRLPTEAEWEYAARAGTKGDYAGSGFVLDMAWYDQNSDGKPHPVALKFPSQWGLYDMHGNVWEWVYDKFSPTYYQESPRTDPTGPAESVNQTRMYRGGSWYTSAWTARSAYRAAMTGFVRASNFGFRLVRSR